MGKMQIEQVDNETQNADEYTQSQRVRPFFTRSALSFWWGLAGLGASLFT
jgi:hypothetical protein